MSPCSRKCRTRTSSWCTPQDRPTPPTSACSPSSSSIRSECQPGNPPRNPAGYAQSSRSPPQHSNSTPQRWPRFSQARSTQLCLSDQPHGARSHSSPDHASRDGEDFVQPGQDGFQAFWVEVGARLVVAGPRGSGDLRYGAGVLLEDVVCL